MIRRLYADLASFKALELHAGLNVLVAEKSRGATDDQTRNGSGKSSALEIIHFLLGSSCEKDSLFRSEALRDVTFGIELELGGATVRAERRGSKHGRVLVRGDTSAWPVQPETRGELPSVSNDEWKRVLGALLLGVADEEGSWSPSFRSMIGYFVRRDRVGGMKKPMAQADTQRTVDQQVNISFLLGLDWTVPQAWQTVRDREKRLGELKKALKDGAFGQVIESSAKVRSQLIVAEDQAKRLREAVASFRLVDEYHDLEREDAELTRRLGELADENTLDRRYLGELERATVEEVPSEQPDLERLYGEVGSVLPELVKRRFEEVRVFHDSIVRNRRAYLVSEIASARERIDSRSREQTRLDARRSELMTILRSSGAVEQLTALQTELSKATTRVEALRQRHDSAEALESGTLRLRMERAQLVERLRLDHAEHDEAIARAVLTFERIASRLYGKEAGGVLTITATDDGPVFEPHFPGEKSKGINNMRIFCFDMMLMLLSLERGRSPGFLIHDSHLFDGVDERQVGKALALGAELADEHGFQYIVTMNTDAIPRAVPTGFDVMSHALPVRLTDATDDGGLFGFRFD